MVHYDGASSDKMVGRESEVLLGCIPTYILVYSCTSWSYVKAALQIYMAYTRQILLAAFSSASAQLSSSDDAELLTTQSLLPLLLRHQYGPISLLHPYSSAKP